MKVPSLQSGTAQVSPKYRVFWQMRNFSSVFIFFFRSESLQTISGNYRDQYKTIVGSIFFRQPLEDFFSRLWCSGELHLPRSDCPLWTIQHIFKAQRCRIRIAKVETILGIMQDPVQPAYSAAWYPAPRRHHRKQPACSTESKLTSKLFSHLYQSLHGHVDYMAMPDPYATSH